MAFRKMELALGFSEPKHGTSVKAIPVPEKQKRGRKTPFEGLLNAFQATPVGSLGEIVILLPKGTEPDEATEVGTMAVAALGRFASLKAEPASSARTAAFELVPKGVRLTWLREPKADRKPRTPATPEQLAERKTRREAKKAEKAKAGKKAA